MRTRIALALGAASIAVPAAAALAPNYQRMAELRAVLALGEIATFGGTMRSIEQIEYVTHDLYRVTAGNCHIDVRIVSLPTPAGMVGARRFEARAGQPICRRGLSRSG